MRRGQIQVHFENEVIGFTFDTEVGLWRPKMREDWVLILSDFGEKELLDVYADLQDVLEGPIFVPAPLPDEEKEEMAPFRLTHEAHLYEVKRRSGALLHHAYVTFELVHASAFAVNYPYLESALKKYLWRIFRTCREERKEERKQIKLSQEESEDDSVSKTPAHLELDRPERPSDRREISKIPDPPSRGPDDGTRNGEDSEEGRQALLDRRDGGEGSHSPLEGENATGSPSDGPSHGDCSGGDGKRQSL